MNHRSEDGDDGDQRRSAALIGLIIILALAIAGSGFRDVTRLAGSDPDLWTGILRANREATVEVILSQTVFCAMRQRWDRSTLSWWPWV